MRTGTCSLHQWTRLGPRTGTGLSSVPLWGGVCRHHTRQGEGCGGEWWRGEGRGRNRGEAPVGGCFWRAGCVGYCWCDGCPVSGVCAVRPPPPSPPSFGLYNIVGNVWEWVQDDWCAAGRPAPGCRKPGDGDRRVKKGGSFLCQKATCYRWVGVRVYVRECVWVRVCPRMCVCVFLRFRYRVAARSENTADTSGYNIGFRCARDLP
jgi:hypothetical protein